MRVFLDRIFTLAGYLAGLFMVATLLAVLASIFGRLLAFDVPGMDAYAGYSMAASAFLALADTLRHGEHIRVTLVLNRLGPKARGSLEILCHAVAIFLAGALAWFSIRLCYQSWSFHDISTGLDATPLWIPQIGMALGATLFFISFVVGLFSVSHGSPTREGSKEEPAHVE